MREAFGGAQECDVVLLWIASGDEPDERHVVRHAERRSRLRAARGIGTEFLGIDPVRNQRPLFRLVAELAVIVAGLARVHDDGVGHARQHATGGGHDEAGRDGMQREIHVGGMQSPQESRTARTGERGGEARVIHPRVHDIRPRRADRPAQRQQRAQRGPAVAHAEVGNRNAGALEARPDVATGQQRYDAMPERAIRAGHEIG